MSARQRRKRIRPMVVSRHAAARDKTMGAMELHVALLAGFAGDRVNIYVDARLVFQKRVSTVPKLGLADSFEVLIEPQGATLTITVPTRAVTGSFVVYPRKGPAYIGVSLDDEGLVCRSSTTPFGYA